MRTITRDEILETWNETCDLEAKEAEALAMEFMREQPALGIYLSAQAEQVEGGVQEAKCIDLCLAIWKALTRLAGEPLKPVAPETIDAAEVANLKMLEDLDEGSEAQTHDAALGLCRDYNQYELIGFALEVLMAGNEETPELAPQSIGLELLAIKTVIDCLDQ